MAGVLLPFAHTYIKEIVPKSVFPRVVHFHSIAIVTGVLTSYITGMAINSIFGF